MALHVGLHSSCCARFGSSGFWSFCELVNMGPLTQSLQAFWGSGKSSKTIRVQPSEGLQVGGGHIGKEGLLQECKDDRRSWHP